MKWATRYFKRLHIHQLWKLLTDNMWRVNTNRQQPQRGELWHAEAQTKTYSVLSRAAHSPPPCSSTVVGRSPPGPAAGGSLCTPGWSPTATWTSFSSGKPHSINICAGFFDTSPLDMLHVVDECRNTVEGPVVLSVQSSAGQRLT